MSLEFQRARVWLHFMKVVTALGVCGLLVSGCGMGATSRPSSSGIPTVDKPEIVSMTPELAEAGAEGIQLRIEFKSSPYDKLLVRWNARVLQFRYCGTGCVLAEVPKEALATPQTVAVRIWANADPDQRVFTVSPKSK